VTAAAAALAAALAAILALAACGGRQMHASDQAIRGGVHFSRLCEDGTYYTRAAAHQGGGPHPIEVFESSPGQGGSSSKPIYVPVLFGLHQSRAWRPAPVDVQLVACSERSGDGSRSGTTCSYSGGSGAPFYHATYDLKVYEARTGRQVASATVTPTNDRCPAFALVKTSDPKVFNRPDPEDYAAALAGAVDE
jgi:hypothetical protein